MVIVSYYTENTPYEQVANEYLIPSLYGLKLLSDVQKVPNLGSWQANTSFKPTFLLQMLNKHPNENILFVDSDATIEKHPDICDEIPEKYYIAAHILDREKWYSKNYPVEQRTELLTGTLWLRNCAGSKNLLRVWIDECKLRTIWEQKVLYHIVKQNNISVYELPIEYCWINTLPNGQKPHIVEPQVVVRHHQASRKYKQLIK